MNIIEAIKLIWPFGGPKHDSYYVNVPWDHWLTLGKKHRIANDWEIKREPREFWISLDRTTGKPLACELQVKDRFSTFDQDAVEIIAAREDF